jgi:hypothetical protein
MPGWMGADANAADRIDPRQLESHKRAPAGCRGNKVNDALKLAETYNVCRVEEGPTAAIRQ